MKVSIKKIKRFIEEEKPKALARYLNRFLPLEIRNHAEVDLDEYAHSLMDKKEIYKENIIKKLKETEEKFMKEK